MNADALERLRLLGEVLSSGGQAAKSLGDFLQSPTAEKTPGCFSDIANHFLQAAGSCDEMARVAALQHAEGVAHGYSAEDSAVLATFETVFNGFAACVVFISALDFTSTPDKKEVLWIEVSKALREGAAGSWRQAELMQRRLPSDDLLDLAVPDL